MKMKSSVTALRRELDSFLAISKAETITFDVFLVGSEFFYGETTTTALTKLNLDTVVFISSVYILFLCSWNVVIVD